YSTSFVAFWLFVRFHVYLAIFSAALIGWFLAWSLDRKVWQRAAVIGFLCLGLVLEFWCTLQLRSHWGKLRPYYNELVELTDWLGEHAAPEAVLANFGTSAAILAYSGCPIVLHP
ncbi:MAG: hypothetical protein AAF492_21590, partial [Verrucomicrobiota bacterium]